MRVAEKEPTLAGHLEQLGEGQVRAMLADGGFRRQRVLVDEWLYEKEAARVDLRDRQAVESLDTAQRAASASESSAKAVERAAEASGRAVEATRQAIETALKSAAAAERSSRWAMWAAIITLLTVFVPVLRDHVPSLIPIVEEHLR